MPRALVTCIDFKKDLSRKKPKQSMPERIRLTGTPGSLRTLDYRLIPLHTGRLCPLHSARLLLGVLSQAPGACGGQGTLATLLQRWGM